jgi:MFS family permease
MARQLTGMHALTWLAFGQFISLVGSAMTQFALSIWIWEKTGEATPLALVGVANMLPIFVSPAIGVFVDRWNRKLTMMISDLGAGFVTIALFALYSTGELQIWHLVVGAFLSSLCGMFQWPAYSAAVSVMVQKDHYLRANALLGLADNASVVLAPSLAAALLLTTDVRGIMMIDIVSFLAAIGSLLFVVVPNPHYSTKETLAKKTIWSEMAFGFMYILNRPSLLGLQLFFLVGNFLGTIVFTLQAPMILARSGINEQALGLVNSMIGIGGVIGGFLLSFWGGPKRRMNGVLIGWIMTSISNMFLGLGQELIVWGIAAFVGGVVGPLINGSSHAIWQIKVPPDMQGKVFSIRRMIAWLANPLAALLVGPLADQVFEPAMRADGILAPYLGGLTGTGSGAGMSALILTAGVLSALFCLLIYVIPAVRNVEDILPDHDTK